MCINQIITEWKEEKINEINIFRNEDIRKLYFAHDQVIMADSEDALQISIHKLETFISKYGIKIPNSERKNSGFKRKRFSEK
jgi:hypothetical protein